MDFQLIPDAEPEEGKGLLPLEKPSLRTSGRLKIVQLKKFLADKLPGNPDVKSVSFKTSIIIQGCVASYSFTHCSFMYSTSRSSRSCVTERQLVMN